ncbi:MAG: isochorismatase family protein [Muribaculaceae bacterium]|nr:isochorismatase family protein [Muribaculaceae bacterium]
MIPFEQALLIIDPQIDFINGTLPVPGAVEAMDSLASYIKTHTGDYGLKILTADSHPYNHFSFVENGGQWPRHCVHDTVGAAIWPAVFTAVYSTSGESHIFHKGQLKDVEEYSIFNNPSATAEITRLLQEHLVFHIDLCGLAGDVCVLATLKDARRLFPHITIDVLTPYSPSIDGGRLLSTYLTGSEVK